MKLVSCVKMPPPPAFAPAFGSGNSPEKVLFVRCGCMKDETRFLLGLNVNHFMSVPLNWGFMIL